MLVVSAVDLVSIISMENVIVSVMYLINVEFVVEMVSLLDG